MGGITGIAYARYRAPDLDTMERFLLDFGLSRSERTATALYMRGTSERHHIHVTELGDHACGVGVGLPLALFAGHLAEPLPPLPVRAPLVLNGSTTTLRRGELQRPSRGPSHIVRMEHAVLSGPNFEEAWRFYQGLLGMKVSDRIHTGSGEDNVVVFLHCGLGQAYTDHHTIALIKSPAVAIDHAAFVALDWDDLMLGHEHLKKGGYRHEWGVGRHIMGSEIFDYWRDPFGNKVEHCFDGDMVNDDHEPGLASIQDDILSIWSPPMSDTFGEINDRATAPAN